MKNILIVNGHQYYDVVAKGELTNKINNIFSIMPTYIYLFHTYFQELFFQTH